MTTHYIGIDPGKKGALAVISDDGIEVHPYGMDTYLSVLNRHRDHAVVCLEQVGARPGQGVTSMFTFGALYGWLQGVLSAYHIPYQLVSPLRWKREFSITADKNSSIAVAQRLFPDVSLLATQKSRVPHDGMAEALLMAEYARRKL